MFFRLVRLACLSVAAISASGSLVGIHDALGQGSFRPGQVIEYKVGTAVPERWEQGRIIRPLEGGKQYLIHEKPSQFFPEGPEKAYSPSDLRAMGGTPSAGKRNSPTPLDAPGKSRSTSLGNLAGSLSNSGTRVNSNLAQGGGLLSRAEVIAYAKQVFGPGDPFADSNRREMNLNQIRDYIRERGTSFLPDLDLSNELGALGAYSVHIGSAIEANYGKHPLLKDYFGSFLLRTTNRGTKNMTREGARVVITATDAQHESGSLDIYPNGTFVWKIGRNDPENQWVRGQWRVARPDELHVWEGGPAIWLEKARQNEDYLVRKCRVPGYEGWIDVGMGKGRIAASYGRRP
ncbi:MAG: hypothetical protein U1A77_09700 [Pirellulales bacterium]